MSDIEVLLNQRINETESYGESEWSRLGRMALASIKELRSELAAAKAVIASLNRWKAHAMEVLPDFQTLGKIMGLTLGDSVYDRLVGWMIATKTELAASKAENAALIIRVTTGENSDNCPFCKTLSGHGHTQSVPMCHLCELESQRDQQLERELAAAKAEIAALQEKGEAMT